MPPLSSSTPNPHKNLTSKEEDYLEAILNISLTKGYARAHDVSEALHVVPSSVSEMFTKLSKKNLVTYRRYEGVSLTDTGKLFAEQIKFRHTILVKFLEILGVPPKIANEDACFMEHELNPITITKIKEFVKNEQSNIK